MKKTNNIIDSLPEEFSSDEEAAEFWDTHSITDYEEFLEPADLEFNLKRRHFEIEVDEESFRALRASAKKQQKPVKHLASEVLKEKLRVL
ncbi:MAG: CopG family antitoxin [Desulfobacterales bacterium]|nr:CopG family antitoxin [Desulfobacterales bacterium]